jgi:hypothetical protein
MIDRPRWRRDLAIPSCARQLLSELPAAPFTEGRGGNQEAYVHGVSTRSVYLVKAMGASGVSKVSRLVAESTSG